MHRPVYHARSWQHPARPYREKVEKLGRSCAWSFSCDSSDSPSKRHLQSSAYSPAMSETKMETGLFCVQSQIVWGVHLLSAPQRLWALLRPRGSFSPGLPWRSAARAPWTPAATWATEDSQRQKALHVSRPHGREANTAENDLSGRASFSAASLRLAFVSSAFASRLGGRDTASCAT